MAFCRGDFCAPLLWVVISSLSLLVPNGHPSTAYDLHTMVFSMSTPMTERAMGKANNLLESNATSHDSCTVWLGYPQYVESEMPFHGRVAAHHGVGSVALFVIL